MRATLSSECLVNTIRTNSTPSLKKKMKFAEVVNNLQIIRKNMQEYGLHTFDLELSFAQMMRTIDKFTCKTIQWCDL